MSVIEPMRWQVRPDGIETTRFSDPESFYLCVRRAVWHGEECYIVSPNQDSLGFTKNGHLVYLRHDVNAKHARHATFEVASALATALADGELRTDQYRYWRDADEQRFGPHPETTHPSREPARHDDEESK